MEISLLKVLLKNISSFFNLPCHDNRSSEIVEKYYHKIEEILKLIKPILESIADAEVASDESLQKEFAGLSQSVDELRELLEDCHPLMSKVYFVCHIDHHLQVLYIAYGSSYINEACALCRLCKLSRCLQKSGLKA